MALKLKPVGGLTPLLKDGYRHLSTMEEALFRNCEACNQLSSLVASSFGPNGRKKLIINHLQKLFLTSDASTIMRELEVAYPAAKLLVFASQQQESEQGDGTNWVITFAGELLVHAEKLVRTQGLHVSEVIEGYERAADMAIKLLESECTVGSVDADDKIRSVVSTCIAGKLVWIYVVFRMIDVSSMVSRKSLGRWWSKPARVLPQQNQKASILTVCALSKFWAVD